MSHSTTAVGAPEVKVDIVVFRNEDWNDSLPAFDGPKGEPFDLTGKALRLTIRPSFDHTVLIHELTSDEGGGIVIDDAAQGLASIRLSRAIVREKLPAGVWEQFLVLEESVTSDPADGLAYRQIWSGSLAVQERRT